jgi:hypothetical protein
MKLGPYEGFKLQTNRGSKELSLIRFPTLGMKLAEIQAMKSFLYI